MTQYDPPGGETVSQVGGSSGSAAALSTGGPADPRTTGGPSSTGGGGSETGEVLLTEAQVKQLCGGWRDAAEGLGAAYFMVLDASASMRERANGTEGRSKWEVTRDAVIEAATTLPDYTALGMLAYPNQEVDMSAPAPSMCVNADAVVPLGDPDSAAAAANAVGG